VHQLRAGRDSAGLRYLCLSMLLYKKQGTCQFARSAVLRLQQRQPLAGPAGEQPGVVLDAEVFAGELAEDGAEVGGDRQVTTFIEGGGVQAWGEDAVDFAA